MGGRCGLRFLERRELLSLPPRNRPQQRMWPTRRPSWERSEYWPKVTPRADGGGGIRTRASLQSPEFPTSSRQRYRNALLSVLVLNRPRSALKRGWSGHFSVYPTRERSWAQSPLLARSPWRVLRRYRGGHICRSPGSALLPPSQARPPTPACDSRSPRRLRFLSITKFVSKQGHKLPRAALWPGDQPHCPSV